MVTAERLNKKQVQEARKYFWIGWVILISMPASMIGWLFSYGGWWGSPIGVIISTVIGHNVFEYWLKRRQERATNTIVLCYCAHTEGVHHPTMGACQHYTFAGRGNTGAKYDPCYCLDYTPRFWQMARRT